MPTKPTPLEFAAIEELAPLLAKKKVSPVELTQLCLSRIERLNPQLNAFITVTATQALAQARQAERELLRGRGRGPLHGIPISLKDNIYTRGVRTTAGSAILRDFLPTDDATVVQRLRRAGAIFLGKTNLHEFAFGITSENPHYGFVRNPWDLKRIPGGSTGGGAAAVAAGLCAAAIGTDTGGSLRIPAAFCNLVGLKPQFGRISVDGVVPLSLSLDHVGPIARSVGDAAVLLAALAGNDARMVLPKRQKGTKRKIRLGLPKEHFWKNTDPEVRRLVEAALKTFENGGSLGKIAVQEVSVPSTSAASDAANTIALVEARQYHQQMGYFPARAAEYGADVRSRLAAGGEVRAVDYLAAWETVHRSRAEFAAALAYVDALVFPSVSIPAPPFGTDRVRIGNADVSMRTLLVGQNRPANLTGFPAISIPCGFTRDGLPVGLQLIGRSNGESALLALAHDYEQQHDWRDRHPPLASSL